MAVSLPMILLSSKINTRQGPMMGKSWAWHLKQKHTPASGQWIILNRSCFLCSLTMASTFSTSRVRLIWPSLLTVLMWCRWMHWIAYCVPLIYNKQGKRSGRFKQDVATHSWGKATTRKGKNGDKHVEQEEENVNFKCIINVIAQGFIEKWRIVSWGHGCNITPIPTPWTAAFPATRQ